MGSLAHTQVRFTELIQVSDVVGEYGVHFLIIAIAAAITSIILPPRKYFALVPAAVLVASALTYGHWQMSQAEVSADKSLSVRVALIQGNTLADWRSDPAKQRETMDEYVGLSRSARESEASRRRPAARSGCLARDDIPHRVARSRCEPSLAGRRGADAPGVCGRRAARLGEARRASKTPVLVGNGSNSFDG